MCKKKKIYSEKKQQLVHKWWHGSLLAQSKNLQYVQTFSKREKKKAVVDKKKSSSNYQVASKYWLYEQGLPNRILT